MHGIWPHHGLLPQCKGLDWRPNGDKRTPFETHPSRGTKIWDPGLDSKNIKPPNPTIMQVELWIFPLDQDCQSGLTQHGVTEGDGWKRQMIFGGSTSCDALLIGSRFDNKQQQERKMKIKVTLISSHPFHESAHCKIWPKQIGQTHKTQLMLPKPFCGPHVLPDSWAVSRKQEWWIAALAASSSSNTFENSRRGRKVGRNTHNSGQFLSNWAHELHWKAASEAHWRPAVTHYIWSETAIYTLYSDQQHELMYEKKELVYERTGKDQQQDQEHIWEHAASLPQPTGGRHAKNKGKKAIGT